MIRELTFQALLDCRADPLAQTTAGHTALELCAREAFEGPDIKRSHATTGHNLHVCLHLMYSHLQFSLLLEMMNRWKYINCKHCIL